MKKLVANLMTGLLFCGLISCEDNDKPEGPDENGSSTEVLDGYFVLCRGNQNQNNASLGYYDFEAGTYEGDIFAKQNGDRMGELAQEMIIYGEKMYITMSGSDVIFVTDLHAKLLKTIKPQGDESVSPRGLAADDGKVFIGYYMGNSVAVLDTVSLTIQQTIPVGRNPEQMAVNKGKLYVTNSGGMDFPECDNTVSVINVTTLKKEKDLEVAPNPTKIVSDGLDNIFVISMGKYTDETNALQKINPVTGTVKKIGNAALMTLANNVLYTIYSQYGWEAEDIKYISYDVQTGEKKNDAYIKEKIVGNPYSLNIDPANEDIYISHFVFEETSDLYIFNKNGEKLKVQETKGYDVAGVWFLP